MQLKVCRQEPRTLDKDGRALTGTFHWCYPVWYKTKRERLYLGEVLFTKVTSRGVVSSGGLRGRQYPYWAVDWAQRQATHFIFSIFFSAAWSRSAELHKDVETAMVEGDEG